jgi:hypothetical protein
MRTAFVAILPSRRRMKPFVKDFHGRGSERQLSENRLLRDAWGVRCAPTVSPRVSDRILHGSGTRLSLTPCSDYCSGSSR